MKNNNEADFAKANRTLLRAAKLILKIESISLDKRISLIDPLSNVESKINHLIKPNNLETAN